MSRQAKHFFISKAHDPQRDMRHVAAPEPSLVERRGLEPRGKLQCQSRPQREGRVRSHGMCGNVGALSSGETGSGAKEHVAASEPSPVERRVLEPRDA
jgi:hypothetical protein